MKKTTIFILINQIFFMIIVTVKNEKSLEQALKQYKFKVYKTKQIQKLQERQEFIKPSIKRRDEIKRAEYRQKNQTGV